MTDEIAELFNLEIDEFNKKPKVSRISSHQHRCSSLPVIILFGVLVWRANLKNVHEGRSQWAATSNLSLKKRVWNSKAIGKTSLSNMSAGYK